MSEPEAPAPGERLDLVDWFVEQSAWYGLSLPLLTTIALLARMAGCSSMVAAIVAAALTLGALVWKRPRVGRPQVRAPWSKALLFLLLAIPPLWISAAWAAHLTDGPLPTRYGFRDQSYELMIARGVRLGFPAPDLSYAGQRVQYHHGGPVLFDTLAQLTRLPLPVVFFGVLPVLVRIALMGSAARIAWLLLGRANRTASLAAAIVAGYLPLADVYNIAWNAHDILVNRAVDLERIMRIVPVFNIRSGPMTAATYYGLILATALFFIVCANLDRLGPIMAGLGLAAVLLVKQQVLLVAGPAWFAAAVFLWFRKREWTHLAACGIVVAIALVTQFFAASGLGVRAGFGVNEYYLWLGRRGNPFPAQLLAYPGVAVACAVVLGAIGTHLIGWSAIRGALRARAETGESGQAVMVALWAAIVTTTLVLTVVVIEPGAEMQQAFDSIHEEIRAKLWLPYETYLEKHLLMAQSSCREIAPFALGLLGATGLATWRERSKGRLRPALGVIGAAWFLGAVVYVLVVAVHAGGGRPMTVSPQAVAALESIPVAGSVLVTDELAFLQDTAMPLMNSWAPALVGHQFWVSNLMFNTFHHADARSRLDLVHRLSSATLTPRDLEVLRADHVTHAFLRAATPCGDRLRATGAGRHFGEYLVLQLSGGDGLEACADRRVSQPK